MGTFEDAQHFLTQEDFVRELQTANPSSGNIVDFS